MEVLFDETCNTAVTKAHIIGTRRPLDASDNNLTAHLQWMEMIFSSTMVLCQCSELRRKWCNRPK